MSLSPAAATSDTLQTTRQRRLLVELVVIAALTVVSLIWFGTGFGRRGLMNGDEIYVLTGSVHGHFPDCTGSTTFINPWRPLQVTLPCLTYRLFGLNAGVLLAVASLVRVVTAYAWFGVTRHAFSVPSWLAFAVAVQYLAYPEDHARLWLIGNYRLLGPMFTLLGVWCLLRFAARPGRSVELVVGLFLQILAFLHYETLLGVWVIGLPLALLYKHRHFSRRIIIAIASTWALTAAYFVWRYAVLPGYTADTFVAGAHEFVFSPAVVVQRFLESYVLIAQVWERAFRWIDFGVRLSTAEDVLRITAISLFVALVVALVLKTVRGLSGRSITLPNRNRGRDLVLAMLVGVPIMAFPFYLIDLDLIANEFRSYGIPFAVALGIVGVILLAMRSRKGLFAAVGIVTILLSFFASTISGYNHQTVKYRAGVYCDFFLRLTDDIARLPPNYVLVVDLADESFLLGFWDSFLLGSMEALFYYEGPPTPAGYSLQGINYSGYVLLPDTNVTIEPDGVHLRLMGIGANNDLLRVPRVVAANRAVVVRYAPFRDLSVIAVPDALQSVVRDDAATEARTAARQLCAWYDPTDPLYTRALFDGQTLWR